MTRRGPPPIDRGWAWVITAGLCLKSFINGGFVKSYGIFFSAFLETFGRSATETQFIKSTRSILATVCGPFGTALSERYTERVVVIVGAVFMSLAFILSSFAQNLEVIIVTFGVFSGIGISLVNGPSKVCLGRYFEKKRGRANSLSLVGTAVGQIVIPPLVSLLMDTYALRGTLLIYGGICLNILITGALLRPIKSYRSTDESTKESDDKGECLVNEEVQNIQGDNLTTSIADKFDKIDRNGKSTTTTASNSNLQIRIQGDTIMNGCSMKDLHLNGGEDHKTNLLLTNRIGSSSNLTERYRGSTKSLSEIIRSVGSRINVNSMEEGETIEAQIEPSETKSPRKCGICSPLVLFFKHIFDKEILTNPLFILYLVSGGLFMIANGNQITFIVPRAEEYGISREMAAVLLSIIGGCDIFGRLIMGVLADVKRLSPHQVMAVGGLLTSIPMLALPLSTNFAGMTASAVVFGLFGSSHAILGLPVLVDFVGKGMLAKGIGLSIFFHGMMSSIFAPILGLVRDQSGSYNNVFYVTGSMQVLGCALLLFLEPLARRYQTAKHPPTITEELVIQT